MLETTILCCVLGSDREKIPTPRERIGPVTCVIFQGGAQSRNVSPYVSVARPLEGLFLVQGSLTGLLLRFRNWAVKANNCLAERNGQNAERNRNRDPRARDKHLSGLATLHKGLISLNCVPPCRRIRTKTLCLRSPSHAPPLNFQHLPVCLPATRK